MRFIKGGQYKKTTKIMTMLITATVIAVMASSIATSANGLPFDDVKPGQWFYTDTEYLYRNGIKTELSDGIVM